MQLPSKNFIADELLIIARLLELKGENPFKIRAYSQAARALENFSGNLQDAASQTIVVPGIGKAIAEKINELLTTGRLSYLENLKAEFPSTLFELFELQGLGGKKIKALYDQLGVDSIESLRLACEDGRIAGLPGFGTKSAMNILKAIEQHARHSGFFRLGDVTALANDILEALRAHPKVIRASAAGSFRRSKEILHDLDFVVSTKDPARVTADFTHFDLVEEVIACGDTKASVRMVGGVQCDLRAVSDEEFPFAISYFTGSKEHNIALRNRALKRGWTLNEYRLAATEGASDAVPRISDEAALYRALGMSYVAPELREDRGEIEAAERGELPSLVEWNHLRGTFHNHTTASDGRATLEEMVSAARELGLEYLGIADHSKSSVQANGLTADRLAQQRKEIARLDSKELRVFAGVECDILKDGSLDFPDEVLASLDYVVASVHSSFTLSESEQTKRILRAISNPHVTMLGHLTGRLLLTREGYAVNVPAVIDAAAETGTMIELNANPHRLDMDWRWWPLAKSKGVKCVINPDAHRVSGLQDLYFGVLMARKGGLERRDVFNCLSAEEVSKVFAAGR